MTVTLRPYQNQAIVDVRAALRHHRRVLLTSPTGSGKTVLTSFMILGAREQEYPSIFLVHRKELLRQTSNALLSLDVPHGYIAGGQPVSDELVQIATVQTLVNRLEAIRAPRLIVVDEAHHATSDSYTKILAAFSKAWQIGLTATPCRTNGQGLKDRFDKLVEGPSVEFLMANGYLSRYVAIVPDSRVDVSKVPTRGGDYVRGELEVVVDQGDIIGNALDHYLRLVAPGSCLIYCVGRNHARHVEEIYRMAGVDAKYVGGDTPTAERDAAVEGFQFGSPRVLVSVDLFSEGLDVPGLRAVQILRHTKSLSLHLQMIGRVLRVEEGKDKALILDHVGNIGYWKGGEFVTNHGLPDAPREWTLEGRKRKKGDVGIVIALTRCLNCFAVCKAGVSHCEYCGSAFPVRASGRTGAPEEKEGGLREIDEATRILSFQKKKAEEKRAKTLADLVRLAKGRKYKMGWVVHRWLYRNKNAKRAETFSEVRQLWKEV